jgi:hypothetical protein
MEPGLQPEAAVPQRLFGQFPKKNNREKFSNNRDRNLTNRVFLASYQGSECFAVVSAHFLLVWLGRGRDPFSRQTCR